MLPPLLILEKNKIASVNPWLALLEVTLTDNTKLYLVHNTEDIVFGGNTYTAFPFQIQIPKIGTKGEIPSWMLKISNVTRILQAYLEQQNGCVGATVILRFVNAGYLSENYADLETTMEVLSSKSDAEWVAFSLGMPNPLRQRFPKYRYIAKHCLWDFNYPAGKGPECAYTGPYMLCEKTLDACRIRSNSRRFGGKIGMDNANVRFA